jgi:hypothetical protein
VVWLLAGTGRARVPVRHAGAPKRRNRAQNGEKWVAD